MVKIVLKNMTTVYNHISHYAQCNFIILSMFLSYKHDRIFNVFKTVILIPILMTLRVFHSIELLMK